MPQRDVTGHTGSSCQRHTAQIGAGGAQCISLGVEGDDPGGIGLRDPAVEGVQVLHTLIGADIHGPVGRRDGRLCFRCGCRADRDTRSRVARLAVANAPGQRAELHLLQKRCQHHRVRIIDDQRFQRRRQGCVAVQLHQRSRQPDLVGKVDQGLAALVLFDFAGAGQQGVEVAVLVDKRRGGLDADAGRAGYVIDGIAAQRLNVDHLVRGHTEFLGHLFDADAHVLHGVEHENPGPDQLHQVLVGGDDHDLAAHVADLAGVGRDQVVGLVTFQLNGRYPERQRRLAHQRKLRDQVFRQWRSVGLVEIVEVVAERLGRVVKDHRQMGRRLGRRFHVHQQLPDHVAEARDRPDRHAVALAGQRWQGVKGAEDETRPVDQV